MLKALCESRPAKLEKDLMTDRYVPLRMRAVSLAVLLAATLGVAGCAGTMESATDAFVDPSIYDLYDCKQLAAERTALASRLAENERLMSKARTGAGGAAVAEVAYRNENLSLQGQIRLADRMWAKNRCENEPQVAPSATAKPRR